MSIENEKPAESIPVPTCGICEAIIADDDTRLVCSHKSCGKLTCLSCIEKMIKFMFCQPALNYSFKCGACSGIFDQNLFDEVIVKQNQYEKYIACILPLYWAKDCLEQNETLAPCKYSKSKIFLI
jgi:hypothetical protein